jgi:hypothetical protein
MMFRKKIFFLILVASLAGTAAAESLQSLLPNSVPAGTTNFAMTVNGAGFQFGDIAYLDGASRPTVVGGDSYLRVLIYTSDVAKAGKHTIVVKNESGVASNALSFTVTGGGSTPPPPAKKVTVSIASPAAGAVACSSFTLSASAVTTNAGATIARWQVQNGAGAVLWSSSSAASSIRVPLKMAAGSRTLVVSAWDSTNLGGTARVSFTVSAASPPCGTSGGGGGGGTGSGPVTSWHGCMRNSGGHDYQAMVFTLNGGGSLPFNATLYQGAGCKSANWLDQFGFGTPISFGGFSYTFWFRDFSDQPNTSAIWTVGNQSSGCINYNTAPQC